MRIVAISDTHCRLAKVGVPAGDLLIHAGDLTFRGDIPEISKELKELGSIAQDFPLGCVVIAGNHDWLAQHNPALMKRMSQDQGLVYLDHESATIGGYSIFGSAYTPEFMNWAFNVPRGPRLSALWDQIPDHTDILVTHGPPMGILDPVERFSPTLGEYVIDSVGDLDLFNRILELKQLKLHVFGHIHLGHGSKKAGDLTFVNASTSTEDYKPTNPPIIVDLTQSYN